MASASAGSGEPGKSISTVLPARKAAFSLTCSRLSQYLKEKGTLGVEMSWALDAANKGTSNPEPPRTMNLFPGVGAKPAATEPAVVVTPPKLPTPPTEQQLLPAVVPQPQSQPRGAQMTIFYGGKVIVFDNYPADKAKDLLTLAGKAIGNTALAKTQQGSSGVPAACAAAPVPLPVKAAVAPAVCGLPAPVVAPVASPAVVVAPAAVSQPQKPPQPPVASDLPIARRVSLNRFLEKRKDRINSKAPYPINAAATSSSDGKPLPEKEKQPAGMPPPFLEKEKAAMPFKEKEMQQQPPWLGLAPSDSA